MFGVNSKKGQITLFVIIGLVLVLSVGLFLFLTSNRTLLGGQVNDISQTNSVETLIDSCLKDTIYESQNTILYEDFYYDSPRSVDYLPYFYFSGRSLLPAKSDVEKIYASKLRPNVIKCLDNFTSVRPYLNGELVLDENYLDLTADMAEDKLTLIANINGGIQSDTGLQRIQTVSTSVPSKVGTFYQGIMLLLYPPFKEGEPFFKPAQEYLESKGISFYAQNTGDAIELYFLLEEINLPQGQTSRLSIAFRFLGSFI